MIQKAIATLVEGNNLSESEATAVFEQIMSGEATEAQIGGYLVAQRMTGETVAEITGAAKVMRSKATPIPVKAQDPVDTCGTGGDDSGSFNISTTSAFVVAGAGVPVAKHGNRSVSSKSGSADLLMELGVNLDLSPEQVGECVDKVGLGFLFAPKLHGAMKYAIGPRRELAMRSIFNLLGPLTNPAKTKRQVMGVFDQSLTSDLAQVLGNLGAEHVWVVSGDDGLDELSICAKTKVAEFKNGTLKNFEFDPTDYGFAMATKEDLLGNSPAENAQITRKILEGEKSPRRDVVVLNAAAAIYVSGKVTSFEKALESAHYAIDSGKALEILHQLISTTQAFKA